MYKLDPYFPSYSTPKYSYIHAKTSNKNHQDKYTLELPTDSLLSLKFSNIYYEGTDDIYQDATGISSNDCSIQVLQDDSSFDSMREEGQKFSSTNSTETENENFSRTSHTYEKCPTVQNVESEHRTNDVENPTYVPEKILKIQTNNFKSPVEYARSAHTNIP